MSYFKNSMSCHVTILMILYFSLQAWLMIMVILCNSNPTVDFWLLALTINTNNWLRFLPKTKPFGKQIPTTLLRLGQLLKLPSHVGTLLFDLRNPKTHVAIVDALEVLWSDGFGDETVVVKVVDSVGKSRLGVFEVAGDEEPAGDGCPETELLQEDDLDDDSQRKPFVLGCMSAGF